MYFFACLIVFLVNAGLMMNLAITLDPKLHMLSIPISMVILWYVFKRVSDPKQPIISTGLSRSFLPLILPLMILSIFGYSLMAVTGYVLIRDSMLNLITVDRDNIINVFFISSSFPLLMVSVVEACHWVLRIFFDRSVAGEVRRSVKTLAKEREGEDLLNLRSTNKKTFMKLGD